MMVGVGVFISVSPTEFCLDEDLLSALVLTDKYLLPSVREDSADVVLPSDCLVLFYCSKVFLIDICS